MNHKSTRDILIAQKEALFSRLRELSPDAPEIVEDLESVLRLIAIEEARKPSPPPHMEFAGMQIGDAITTYLERLQEPRTVSQIVEALMAGGVGVVPTSRPTEANIKDSIRYWSGKGKFLRNGELVWLAEWGDSQAVGR